MRARNLIWGLALSTAALAPPRMCSGQEETTGEDTSAVELEEVVVTAKRRATSAADAPAIVDVITEEDMGLLPAVNPADLLEDQAGIQTSMPQGQGIVIPQSITLRGLRDSGRTLFLVDGQPWNGSWTDYFYFSTLPFEAIDRVEVVRGPFSSLYGTNAMAGVVHFFTRDGWGEKPSTSLRYAGGDFGRQQAWVTAAAGGEKVSAFVSYSNYLSDNYFLNDEHPSVYDPANRDVDATKVHAHIRVKPAENLDLHFTAGHFEALTGFGISSSLSIENEMDANRDYWNAFGTWDATDAVEVFFGLDNATEQHDYRGETLTTVVPFPTYVESINKSGYDRLRFNAGSNFRLAGNNTLTVGGEHNWLEGHKKIVGATTGALLPVFGNPGEEAQVEEDNYSLYLQDDLSLADEGLELVLGLRLDGYEVYGDETSPKLALNWHYSDSARLKFSVGKAFRAPTIDHRYSPPWSMNPVTTYIPNPDLGAETLVSYDLGLENEFPEQNVRTRIAGFYTDADDFIQSVVFPDPINPGFFLMQPQNIQEVTISGGEGQVTYEPRKDLRLFLNYQYADTRDKSTDEVLANHPYHILNLGAAYVWRGPDDSQGFTASLRGRYEGARKWEDWTGGSGEIDGWMTFDLRLSYDLLNRRLAFFADVYNLFNEDAHMTSEDDYVAERNLMVGVQGKFEF